MTDQDRQRLAAILGRLGSAHAGEREAAAYQAEALRKKLGLTWEGLLETNTIYVDREVPVERMVVIHKEVSPWLDRLLVTAIFIGVPLGIVALAYASR